METLKKKILDKREFKGLNVNFLDVFIEEYIKKNPSKFNLLKEKDFNEKSKEFLLFKKYVRKRLREVHGVFSKNHLGVDKKKKLLEKISSNKHDLVVLKDLCLDVLKSHRSSFERLEHYDSLYKELSSLGRSFLDLGSGLNGFSYVFLQSFFDSDKVFYAGVDINEDEVLFVNDFFRVTGFDGLCLREDLTLDESVNLVGAFSEKFDVCLMFKLLDSLEAKKRGSSKLLFNSIKSKFVVVSFACKSIGGKQEIKSGRSWFKRIISNRKFRSFKLGEEEYFVINM